MPFWSRLFEEATDVADVEQCEGGLGKILFSVWCGVFCGSVAEPQTDWTGRAQCMYVH